MLFRSRESLGAALVPGIVVAGGITPGSESVLARGLATVARALGGGS